MTEYGNNVNYLTKDGEPWFPVMGELHYSRYHEDLWEESLRKMKAAGVTVVSAYVIWIHHEEEEGVFDFSGCRNLRKFVETCKKVGISMFLRVGPWVHGEVRNGGFPDWLQNKEKEGLVLRSNAEEYMAYVRRYWTEVAKQTEGLFHKDGGPIIGMQIENEYGHVGGLQGEEGEAHIRALTALAKELGMETPFYTATGWGGACIGDLLPVMGGYCEAPWDQRITEIEADENYVFTDERNDALIASDHHVATELTFDVSKYPFLTAELGGGLQVTKHRRPVCHGKDIGGMTLTKLGSGVALLGYYMYHGGSNPKGKFSTLQESRATGYLNDLPEINYDFNAPIRQYGTISENLKELKTMSYFVRDFGYDLAPLQADIEEKISPEDTHSLRTSCRHDDTHGYVFVNNYQRRRVMDDHKDVTLVGKCAEPVTFPSVDIPSGFYGFYPYNMKLGNAVLRSALATPMCRLQTKEKEVFVFYGDIEPQYQWEREAANVLTLTRREALDAWKVTLDQDYLIISDNFVWEEDGTIKVTGGKTTEICCYPELTMEVPGFVKKGVRGEYVVYERIAERKENKVSFVLAEENEETAVYEINVQYGEKGDRLSGQDTLLLFTYSAESMELFVGDEKINDHFYTGQTVPLSLGYFAYPEKIRIVLHALHENAPIFLETLPEFENGKACKLEKVEIVEEFR